MAQVKGLKFVCSNGKEIKLSWAYAKKDTEQAAADIEKLLRECVGAEQLGDILELTSTEDMGISLAAVVDTIKDGTAHELTSVEEGLLLLHLTAKKAKVAVRSDKAAVRTDLRNPAP